MSGPRHIAFVDIPAYGHVAPTLEIARRLVRRGHRVSYAITGEYAAAVAATGAEVVPYSSELSEHLAEVRDTGPDEVGWWPAGFLRESLALLPVLTERFTADRPDVLAVDVILGACGRLLRHDLGVPVLQTTPTFASNAHYSQLDAVLAAAGVRADYPGLAAARDLGAAAAGPAGRTVAGAGRPGRRGRAGVRPPRDPARVGHVRPAVEHVEALAARREVAR